MPDDTMVQPGARLNSGPPPGGGGWIQRHKGIAIGGGIAVVTLVGYLFYRSRQNAAAAAAQSTPTSTSAGMTGSATDTNTTGYGYYPYTGGYGGTMDMTTLASIMNSMESQIAAQSSTSSTTPTTSPGTTGFNAGGLTTGGVIGSGTGQFEQVPNVQENQALFAAHIPQYEEVAPGDFIPITKTYKYKGQLGALPGGITPYTYIYNSPPQPTSGVAA